MTVVQVATVLLALIGASNCRPQEDGASLQESEERCVNRNINQPLKSLCVTKECIEASNRLWQNMDTTADPCQDFNQFACGGFIQNQIVPEDKGKLSSFTPATEEVYRRTRVLMDVKDSDPVWKTDKKVIDHFKSCMDQEALEEKGLTPVKDLLKELGGWPVLEGDDWNSTNFEWYDYSLKSLELGVSGDYILDAYIYRDSKNISYRVWYIDQPSLGMSREYLVKGFDDKDVQHYYNYMVEAAKLMGANEVTANASMKEALLFEIQIAKASTAREFRRDPNAIYHPETLDKYVAPDGYPNVKELLESVMKSVGVEDIELRTDEKIIIEDPDYIKKSSALLTNTDKRVIANYLGWRVLKARIFSLNKAARKLKEDYNRNLKGIARDKPVWKTCLINSGFNTYSGTLVGAAGSMYARKYFKKEEKTAVEDMIGYLRTAFAQIVRNLDWMDDETKVEALKKLDKMDQYIAYPNEVLDQTTIDEYYKELVVTNDFFENELNQNKFSDKKSILRLREKYDPKYWTNHDDVAVVNAFYSSGTNSIKFPAGILQDLFFSSKVPKYLNYGAIGGVIGHEITHGFDDKGRKKDFEGKLTDWWSNSTNDEYSIRAKCIIDQYGNFTANQIGLKLDGVNTQGENIADNGGTKEAYIAYKKFVKEKVGSQGEPRLPGHNYSPEQMFWISWGQVWCAKWKDGQLKSQVLTGSHSPGEFRINGPLSNNPDFAEDFKCPSGSPMNPKKKCSVW